MAIVDLTVIPIGTETPSVSRYVAEVQKILARYQTEDKIQYQLTPMSTLIEGDLPVIFDIINTIHEELLNNGTMRLATNIRIDDRRDKASTMQKKIESVKAKM